MSILKEQKSGLIKQFSHHEKDTGSVDVQCAVLTEQIKSLTLHAQKNPKDFQSRRGLLVMVNKRKRLLSYYKRVNVTKYQELIARLGLKK
jgi:small subunit ribosomal protein S15